MKSNIRGDIEYILIIFILSIGIMIVGPLWGFGIIGRTPKIGDYYVYSNQYDNPFVTHETNVVLAVKNGYVSYRNSTGEWNSPVTRFRVDCKYAGHTPAPPAQPLVLEDAGK